MQILDVQTDKNNNITGYTIVLLSEMFKTLCKKPKLDRTDVTLVGFMLLNELQKEHPEMYILTCNAIHSKQYHIDAVDFIDGDKQDKALRITIILTQMTIMRKIKIIYKILKKKKYGMLLFLQKTKLCN
jgi:hypothetical protein